MIKLLIYLLFTIFRKSSDNNIMDPGRIITELQRNVKVFNGLLMDLDEKCYLWKPEDNKWCLLEIVCHLHDEEREDFRARVQNVLETPEKPFIPIDPVGWVKKRNYIGQDYRQMVEKFFSERATSVDWLKSFKNPIWNNQARHPKLGPMSASQFLTNWLAHDYLHIRQINRTKYQFLNSTSGEDLSYAGSW